MAERRVVCASWRGRPHVVVDAVGGLVGVLDLEVDEAVHLDAHIVFGDADLGGDVGHLLLQAVAVRGPVHEGDQDVEAGFEGAVVLPQALDDVGAFLGDDESALDEHD